jgi:hypothetical protein
MTIVIFHIDGCTFLVYARWIVLVNEWLRQQHFLRCHIVETFKMEEIWQRL